jgi:hypothetical protein
VAYNELWIKKNADEEVFTVYSTHPAYTAIFMGITEKTGGIMQMYPEGVEFRIPAEKLRFAAWRSSRLVTRRALFVAQGILSPPEKKE